MPGKIIKQPFKQNGSAVISLVLTLIIILSIGFIYYYYTKLNSLGTIPLPITRSTSPTDHTNGWKNYEDQSIGLSLKIPPDWYVSDDNKFISQFPYNSKRVSINDIYNVFYITRGDQQIQSGYTNTDWINRINSLKPDEKLTNEYRPAANLQLVKLASGQTADKDLYVIFKNTAQDDGVVAIFQNGNSIFQFVLKYYDQTGIQTLQEILATTQIDSPPPTP